MAIQHVDEVLAKAVSSDSTAIPRYNILDSNGNVLYANAQLVLANTISTAGTPVNKALLDEFLAASGSVSGTATGTALTLSQTGFVLTDGAMIRFKYTGTTVKGVSRTLNVNSTGAKYLCDATSGTTAVTLRNNIEYIAIYNSSVYRWILLNGGSADDSLPIGTIVDRSESPGDNWDALEPVDIYNRYATGYAATVALEDAFLEVFTEHYKASEPNSGQSSTSSATENLFASMMTGALFANGYYFTSSSSESMLYVYSETDLQQTTYAATMAAATKLDISALPWHYTNISYTTLVAVTYYSSRYILAFSRSTGSTTYYEMFSTASLGSASSYVRIFYTTNPVNELTAGASGVLVSYIYSSSVARFYYYTASVTTTDSWVSAGAAGQASTSNFTQVASRSAITKTATSTLFAVLIRSSGSQNTYMLYKMDVSSTSGTVTGFTLLYNNRYYTSTSAYTSGVNTFTDYLHWQYSSYIYIFGCMHYGTDAASAKTVVGVWRISVSSPTVLTVSPYTSISVPSDYPVNWTTITGNLTVMAQSNNYSIAQSTTIVPGFECIEGFGNYAYFTKYRGLISLGTLNTPSGSSLTYYYTSLYSIYITRSNTTVGITLSRLADAPVHTGNLNYYYVSSNITKCLGYTSDKTVYCATTIGISNNYCVCWRMCKRRYFINERAYIKRS